MYAVQPMLREGRRNHLRRQPLAIAHHTIACARSQLTDCRNTTQQIIQRIKPQTNLLLNLAQQITAQQVAGRIQVAVPQS